jgi:hypothetical protein
MYVAFILIMGFNYIMSWIISLLSGEPIPEEAMVIEPLPEMEAVEQVVRIANGSEILQSIVFWIFLTLLIGYAFYQYIRQNEELLEKLRGFGLWRSLERLLDWVRTWTRGLGEGVSSQVGSAVRAGLDRLRGLRTKGAQIPFDFVNINRLTPRQRVLFFYLALVRRGADAGIPRHPDQTPYEYQQALDKYFLQAEQAPEAAQLRTLTDSFLEARYSLHPISVEQAGLVKRIWARLRQVLKKR